MRELKRKGRRITALLLSVIIMLSMLPEIPVKAETVTTVVPAKALVVHYNSTARVRAHADLSVSFQWVWDGSAWTSQSEKMTISSVVPSAAILAVNIAGATLDGSPISVAEAQTLMGAHSFTTPSISLDTSYPFGSGTVNAGRAGSGMYSTGGLTGNVRFNIGGGGSVVRSASLGWWHNNGAWYPAPGSTPMTYSYNGSSSSNSKGFQDITFPFSTTFTIPATTQIVPYDPIITADPDLEKTLGDPVVDWTENISATWGYTTANTIPTMGTIADLTLVGGNDPDLSTTGADFDLVGWKNHNYRVEDSTADATFETTSRNIIVRSSTAPDLKVYYNGTSTIYGGEWLSQHASADSARQKTVDIVATTSDPGTTYDTTVFRGSAEHSFSNSNTHTIAGFAAESLSSSGDSFHAQLLGTGNHAIELSPKSGDEIVKIDSTIPVANLNTGDNWATVEDASTDALSGVDTTYFMILPNGDPAPAISSSGWTVAGPGGSGAPSGISAAGYYDIYAYAVDHATNKSAVTAVALNVLVPSSEPAVISATYVDDGGVTQNYPSGTWINKDITVEVDEGAGFSSIVPWYGAIYEGVTPPAVPSHKAGTANSGVDHTYTAEIANPGLTVTGYLVDAADTKLSASSSSIVLKIDKHDPDGDLSYNAGSPDYGFTDTSTDTASPVGANSGVDPAKTVVAMVPYGSPAPLPADYVSITGAEIPDDGIYYDVWVIATDHAGNKSVPVRALEHISYSLDDEVKAKDFAYDIAAGSASLTDGMAKMLSHVEAIYQGGGIVPLANIDVDPTELQDIKDAMDDGLAGTVWPLTFITQGGTSGSVTISVTLYDHGSAPDPVPGPLTHELIYGNNFTYGMSNGAITDDVAKIFAKTVAFDTNGDVIPAADITVDVTELQDINDAIAAKDKSGNPFPLTFYTPDGTSVTVDVTLKDHGNGPVNPGDDIITANDFDYGLDEPAIPDNLAKVLAQVDAKDENGAAIDLSAVIVDTAELQAINDAIAAQDKSGSPFPLTFSTPGGAEVTVKVTLKDHGAGDPLSSTDHIVANDFFYGLDQPLIVDDLAKLYANVTAVEEDGTPIDLSNISVDPSELQDINDAIAAADKSGNPFPLTFTTLDGTSVTVQVTLYDKGAGPNTPGVDTDRIGANDFSYGIDQGEVTNAMAKVLAEVEAAYAGGADMPLSAVLVDAGELQAINKAISDGIIKKFPLSFRTPDGTSVTITVTLKDHGNPALDPVNPVIAGDQITANNFGYGVNETDITDDMAKQLSYVEARDVNGNPIDWTGITVDAAELTAINANKNAGILGGNPLTFTTPDGTAVTITVTLKNHGAGTVVPGSSTDHIVGNDFAYGIDQGAINPGDAKVFAAVDAKDPNGFPIALSDITADSGELQDINDAIAAGELGEYPLTFTTPDGTSVTVNVTLKDNGGGSVDPAVPVNNTERIAANGFIYGIDEGDLSDTEAKFRSQVAAVDKNGNPIDAAGISADAAELAAINKAIKAGQTGSFPLTYSTPDGSTAKVAVILKEHAPAPDTNPGDSSKTGSGNIGANDFMIGINEKGAFSDTDAKLRGRVIAKDIYGNNYDLSLVSVDAGELKVINDAKAAGRTGIFPLTYTSPEGKSVSVKVTVLNQVKPPVIDPADPSKNESSIGANNFNYGRDEGELTADKAKKLANIVAKDKDGNPIPLDQIKVDKKQLKAINNALKKGKFGKFPLTYTEPDGKSVTIDVAIFDHVVHNPNPDNKQEIGGNDFKYDIQDGKLTADKAQKLAKVYAKDQLGIDIPADQIHVNQKDLDKINKAIKNGETGEFKLRFTTDDGQELCVTITLFDGKVVSPDDVKTASQRKYSPKGAGRLVNGRTLTKAAKTGDMSGWGLWLALAVLAMFGIGITVAVRRKTNKNKS